MVNRFKVLIITGGYLPAKNYGGPVVSIRNIVERCGRDFQFYIVTTDHDLNESERFCGILDGWNEKGNARVMYLKQSQINRRYIQRIVNSIDPDLIYQNGFFNASLCIPAFIISKKLNIPMLIAPRGELCINAFRSKRYKKKPYVMLMKMFGFLKGVYFQSTSNEETDQIKKVLNIDESMIIELENIPSMDKMIAVEKAKSVGELKIVFLSRIQIKKNLHFAIDVLKDLNSNITYDIYGPIENAEYWDECKKLINDLPPNVSVNYKGSVEHDNVISILSNYHVMFLPTLSENYGHAIVESMLAGCPVIISDQTPWNDINQNKAGWAISLKEKEKFIKAIEIVANMNRDQYYDLVDNNNEYIKKRLRITETVNEYKHNLSKIIQD